MATRLLVVSLGLVQAGRIEVKRHDHQSGVCPPPLTQIGDKGCFYKCGSDLSMSVVEPSRKGLALDDTTLHWCPENTLFHWPNSDEPVTSFRMFKAWASHWSEPWTSKEKAWRSLAKHLKASGGQVLVGTQISCSEEQDDADWENVMAMVKIFGPDHIMGLAIGNELELLWTKGEILGEELLAECLDRMWIKEYFLNKFHSRVKEFDTLGKGFDQVKVTSVFGGFILAEPGWPFYDRTDKQMARIGPFVKNVTKIFGDRYAHTVNIYPYFEHHFIEYDEAGVEPPTCDGALDQCKKFSSNADWSLKFGKEQSNFAWMVGRLRQRLEGLGNKDSLLWVGETGWSYPKAATLDTKMKWCPDWNTKEPFAEFYANFLDWDMNMKGKYRGPDHVFYFTMRDASNFGKVEGFGLVGDGDPKMWCVNTTCKIQKSSFPKTTTTASTTEASTTDASTTGSSTTDTTTTTTVATTNKPAAGGVATKWQYLCNGFVSGNLPNREGFGKASGANSIETCLDACDAHAKCNTVTFDQGSKDCWMERIPAMPTSAACDNNRNGHAYWRGEHAAPHADPRKVTWQFVCQGFVKGSLPGREGFGEAPGAHSKETCQRKCDEHGKCNSVTWDSGSKKCWMERIPSKPAAGTCDGNKNGGSYWRGQEAAAPAAVTPAPAPAPNAGGGACSNTCPGMDECTPQLGPGWCYRKCTKGGKMLWCSEDCKCK